MAQANSPDDGRQEGSATGQQPGALCEHLKKAVTAVWGMGNLPETETEVARKQFEVFAQALNEASGYLGGPDAGKLLQAARELNDRPAKIATRSGRSFSDIAVGLVQVCRSLLLGRNADHVDVISTDQYPDRAILSAIAKIAAFDLDELELELGFECNRLVRASMKNTTEDDSPRRLATKLRGLGLAIVEYLWDRQAVDFDELEEKIWFKPTSDDTIATAIRRAQAKLIEIGEPIWFEIGGSKVTMYRTPRGRPTDK